MTTKADVIREAYDEIRISGLTVDPNPSDQVMALSRLESMMAEYFHGQNLNVGYQFETTPQMSTLTAVPIQHKPMMVYNLAVRLIPAFNKQVPEILYRLATSSFSTSLGIVAGQNVRQIRPPRRMPRGSGNTYRTTPWMRYANPYPLPPNDAETNRIAKGETLIYQESFDAWLAGNTIDTYTIEADPLLTIDSSAISGNLIDYTITASTAKSGGPWQYVKITVTDSAGRVDIRIVNFEVTAVPEVG